jgi:hypothetical protein
MAQHQNVAVVWGIGTTDITVGTGLILRINGQTYSRESEMVEHRSTSGEVIGRTRFNFTKRVELEVYPTASTVANANAAMLAAPEVGEAVTLTDSVDTDISGVYEVMEASRPKSPTEKVMIRLVLLRNEGFTPGAPITS